MLSSQRMPLTNHNRGCILEQLSIIIPMYNCQETICKCIESIKKQTYQNWKLLLIDDGSTDQTAQYCKKFIESDTRIHYMYQANRGVSSARNLGLQYVQSKYLMFVDADDELDLCICEKLVSAISAGYDLAICGFVRKFFIEKKLYSQKCVVPNCINIDNFIDYKKKFGPLYKNTLFTCVYAKIYCNAIIKNNHIEFDESLSLAEDVVFNITYHQYVNNIAVINEPLYIYKCINSSCSLSSRKNNRRLDIAVMLFKTLIDYVNSRDMLYETIPYIEEVFFKDCFNYLEYFYGPALRAKSSELLYSSIITDILNWHTVSNFNLLTYRCLFRIKSSFLLYIFILMRRTIKRILRGNHKNA